MRHPLLAALALVVLLAAPAGAQPDYRRGVTSRPEMPSWISRVSGSQEFFNIHFPGGTLQDYLNGAESTFPLDEPELVMSSETAQVRLPAIDLEQVSWRTIFEAPTKLIGGVSIESAGGRVRENGPDGQVQETTYFFVRVHPDAILAQASPSPRFDLEFAGGTLAQYVESIRAANPVAGIVIMPDAAAIPMPPVQIKSITTSAALELAERTPDRTQGIYPWIRITSIRNAGAPEPVFTVEGSAGPREVRRTPTVLSLASLLGDDQRKALAIDDILSAVEAATNMTSPAPTIRYHEPTRLLLFYGTAEQADILQRTIDALGKTAAAPRE